MVPQKGFPGLIAPASLKPESEYDLEQKEMKGFSGVNRPGLIEARTTRQTCFRPPLGFPGLIAPASLKRMADIVSARRPEAVFRG